MKNKINYEKAFEFVKEQVNKEYGWALEAKALDDRDLNGLNGMIIAYESIIRLIKHLEENEDYGCFE